MFTTYVTYNLQSRPNKKSIPTLDLIQAEMKKICPTMTPMPTADYHVTFGQSTYFAGEGDDRTLANIDPHSTRVSSDHGYIFHYLKWELSQKGKTTAVDSHKITGFRISEHGFIIAELETDGKSQEIASAYQAASDHTTAYLSEISPSQKEKLAVTKYYTKGSTLKLHISLGKLDNSNLKYKDVYASKLEEHFRKYQSYYAEQNIHISSKGILKATCKSYGKRVILAEEKVAFGKAPKLPLSVPSRSAASSSPPPLYPRPTGPSSSPPPLYPRPTGPSSSPPPLYPRPTGPSSNPPPLYPRPTGPSSLPVPASSITSSSTPRTHTPALVLHRFPVAAKSAAIHSPLPATAKPSIPEIKTAIDALFPLMKRINTTRTVDVGSKLSTEGEFLYNIAFGCQKDRGEFCKLFAQAHSGERGKCFYSDDNINDVWMDLTAMKTLVTRTSPAIGLAYKI